jgi:hypothetical protein
MRLVRDRFAVGLLAALLTMVGVVAFYYPIHLGDYDPWGRQIPCGTAIAPDAGQAVEADMYTANPPRPGSAATPTQYVAQCNRAVWLRRGWSVPLVLVGVAVVALAAMRSTKPPSS